MIVLVIRFGLKRKLSRITNLTFEIKMLSRRIMVMSIQKHSNTVTIQILVLTAHQ